MRQHLCDLVNFLLSPLKINAITKKNLSENLRLRDNLISLYNDRCKWEKKINATAACLVFSKDRVMQLNAFLTSLYSKISSPLTTHVLYVTSSAEHQQSYEELDRLFHDFPIHFHRQKNSASFKSDLLALLTDFSDSKIVFFVDDIVVTENINLDDLLKFDTDLFVPSLRLGLNLKENYTTCSPQPLPDFHDEGLSDVDKIIWHWQKGVLDWGYPLSVDGHIFLRQEMLSMLKLIDFSAPNSMEDSLQCFKPLFAKRYGVAYKKSKIMNLPCNKVQTENQNLSGSIHQDELLQKWNDGYVINLAKFDCFENTSAHQETDIQFIKK